MTAGGERWHTAHVYYHDDGTDLILDAVRPLFAEVAGSVRGAYVTRHWRQGPHLRVNLRATPETWATTVRPAVDRLLGEYLRRHPSTNTLDERAELARHRLLAEREHERGPLQPWFPNNSIQYQPPDRRLHVLGSEAAADLLSDFYRDAADLAFAMLDRVRAGADRLVLGLDLMFAVAHTMFAPITRGYVSYRSHLEGFLASTTDPRAARDRFDRQYQPRRAALAGRLHAVLETLDGSPTEPIAFVRDWVGVMRRSWDRGEPLIRAGELSLDPPAGSGSGPVSEFHALLAKSPAYQALRQDPDFLCYRLVLNYLYLHLTGLGVTPVERFLLCHLAASTVEEVFDLPDRRAVTP